MESLSIDGDYKIIVIDSLTSKKSSDGNCDFYIDLDEPLRNVYKLKIIANLINIKPGSSINSNLESIYIDLNNYTRLISKYASDDITKTNNIYYFDSLIVENSSVGTNQTIKNDYNNADIEYSLNPIEPQIYRFKIQLFNKNNVLLNFNNDVNRFIMKLGVYYNNKKTTRL